MYSAVARLLPHAPCLNAKKMANAIITKLSAFVSGMEATAAKHNFDDVPRVVKQPFMDKLEFFKGCLDGAARVLNDDGHGSLPVKDLKDC